ncbi:MAG TPA: hypothetical protein VK165_10005, partial [Azonexus sp.]|nr:hypothetical protein [Azonexus sp.]
INHRTGGRSPGMSGPKKSGRSTLPHVGKEMQALGNMTVRVLWIFRRVGKATVSIATCLILGFRF